MRSHLEWGDFGQWESTKEHKGDLDSEGKLKVRIVVRAANLWRYQAVGLRPVGLCTDSKQASGMNAYRSLGVPVRTSADQPVGRCAQSAPPKLEVACCLAGSTRRHRVRRQGLFQCLAVP